MEILLPIIILIGSVVLHEIAHGFAALKLGDPTAKLAGRLTLNPLPHLDLFGSIIIPGLLALTPGGLIFGYAKPVPYNPYNLRHGQWGEALVAMAGPATNLLIAVVFAVLLRIEVLTTPGFAAVAQYAIVINIVLMIFNLVPIPPLDGSKLLFAILPDRFSDLRSQLEMFGFPLVIVFAFFGFQYLWPVVLWIAQLLIGGNLGLY